VSRDASEGGLLGLTGTTLEGKGHAGIDLRGRDVGWRVQIGVERESVLVLKARNFEGTEGLVCLDFGATAFPLRTGVEAGGRLLQGVEQECGATVLDAVIRQRIHDLLESSLDGVHVIEDRHLEAAGLAVQTKADGLHAAGAGVEVEVAIALVAKSGGTAVDTIFLKMVASTVGHDAS
jgi:hypothetical protein